LFRSLRSHDLGCGPGSGDTSEEIFKVSEHLITVRKNVLKLSVNEFKVSEDVFKFSDNVFNVGDVGGENIFIVNVFNVS